MNRNRIRPDNPLNTYDKTTITIRDDDTRGLTFHRTWPDVDEGGSEIHTLKLSSEPTDAVTVKIVSNNQDVTVSPTSLTFNPSGSNLWSTAQTVTVHAAQDNDAVDDTATLTYTTSGGDYGGANALSIDRPVSVDDDDTAAVPTVNLPTVNVTAGATVTEGSPARFTVTATPAPTSPITVNLFVEDSNSDFVAASEEGVRTVVLNSGTSSREITVPTVNDNTDEDDGYVEAFVNDGTGYTAGGGSAVRVLDNDDPIPGAFFRSASSDAVEHGGTHEVQVDLDSPAPAAGITLRYSLSGTATAGSSNDFTIQNSGSLAIAAGATSATIPVAINDDTSAESDETVILVLTGGTGYTLGSPSVHTLTITDNDGTGQATLSLSGPTGADEGNSGTSDRYFTVSLSSAPSRFVSWQLCFSGSATIDAAGGGTIPAGADYQAISGQTPIDLRGRSPVCTSRTFKTTDSSFTNTDLGIRIKGDTESESDETVTVTLRIDDGPDDVVLGTSVVTYTIRDDDATSQPTASFASGSSSAAEDAGTRNVRVNLFPAAPSGGLTLGYSVSGTATAGGDFTIRNSGTLRVAAEATSAVIPVAISDDRTEENDETVILTLTDGTGYTLGSTRVHTLTITDNDGTGSSPTTPVASFASASSSAAESAGTRNVRVNLSEAAPSGGLSLGYNVGGTATAGSDFTISNSGTVRVTARATTVTIPVAINDDGATESAEETVILTLTDGEGYTVGSPTVHTLTITDDEPDTTDPPATPGGGNPGNNGGNQGVSGSEGDDDDENDQDGQNQDPTPATSVVAFAADTSRPREDAGTSNVTVTLAPAPAAALTVHYTVTGTATAGRDFTALAGSVAVSAGATRVTIPVGLIDDRMDEGAETVILTLTDGEGYTLGETQVHTLTITDNDTAGLQASPSTVHLAEAGEQATVSVHLTSQPTAPVTVTFASSRGRVATIAPATLLFTPDTWQTPQTVTITAGADGLATLRGTVQSNDRGYAALASGALPHIRVRVGADLTGLTTPWLARFGRTVTSQAVTGVTARLSAARTPGLTGTVAGLALDRMGEEAASTPATTRLTPALAPSDPRLNPGGQQLTLRDILAGSAFALTSDPSATGGSYALWGQGAWTRFAGQAGAQDVEGNVLSGTLGVDWAQGAWVLGVAVSHTQGDGDAAQTTAQVDLASSLTLVTPYVGVDVTEHLSLWGTMGYGRGTVGLTRPTASEVETDLSLFLVAGGVRERLLEPAPTGGLAVAVRSEARFLRTMADADTAQGLAASEADVGLLRVGLESSWQQPLADGGAVVPRLDLGFRQDLGEAETGLGLEVQGGVRWEAPAHGLTLDVTGQTLLAHSDQEFETWGGSATVQWAANPNSAAGPALTLRQTYGAGTGTGATTFWTENPVALLQAPGPAELRLTADFGWGVPLQAGLGVPHVQYGWGPTSRDIALGWRLLPTRATEMTLELTATHREAVRTAPVQGIALSLTRQW